MRALRHAVAGVATAQALLGLEALLHHGFRHVRDLRQWAGPAPGEASSAAAASATPGRRSARRERLRG